MTEREKTELLAYLVNELMRLDDDIVDRRNALYRHENYISYHYELAEAVIRQKAFKKFSQDVLALLGLRVGESESIENDDYLDRKTES
ncbi:MAG: hypothetical protein IJ642_06015 [Oscillospiraceae bacterium]|nr:hypothetical protein [Oscillospiraceae bacterium]MBR1528837.1 hypothetical protein [Oscillospiraceae bacterium]